MSRVKRRGVNIWNVRTLRKVNTKTRVPSSCLCAMCHNSLFWHTHFVFLICFLIEAQVTFSPYLDMQRLNLPCMPCTTCGDQQSHAVRFIHRNFLFLLVCFFVFCFVCFLTRNNRDVGVEKWNFKREKNICQLSFHPCTTLILQKGHLLYRFI